MDGPAMRGLLRRLRIRGAGHARQLHAHAHRGYDSQARTVGSTRAPCPRQARRRGDPRKHSAEEVPALLPRSTPPLPHSGVFSYHPRALRRPGVRGTYLNPLTFGGRQTEGQEKEKGQKKWKEKEKKRKAERKRRMQKRSTGPSRVVPHRSTTPARTCLTSLLGWEAVSQADIDKGVA